MVWAAVAVGVGTIAMGAVNANQAEISSRAANANSLDIAETPTRSTGIDQLIRDVTSSTNESGTSTEQQNLLEELMQDEQFMEQFQEQFDKQSQSATDSTTNNTSNQETSTQQQQDTINSVTRGDAASQEALAGLVQGGDSQAAVDAMVNKILREGKADISNVGTRSGSFGSTTEQLLNNDLITKAAEAGALQQIQQDQLQLDAIAAAQAGTETSTGTATGTETGTATGSETGNSSSTQTGSESGTSGGTSSGESTSNQTSEASSDTTSTTDKTTDTVSSDNQTGINDTYVNPGDDVTPEGVLADMVDRGLAMPTNDTTIDGVGPTRPLFGLGPEKETTPTTGGVEDGGVNDGANGGSTVGDTVVLPDVGVGVGGTDIGFGGGGIGSIGGIGGGGGVGGIPPESQLKLNSVTQPTTVGMSSTKPTNGVGGAQIMDDGDLNNVITTM